MKYFCTCSFIFLYALIHVVENEEDKYLITLVYRFVFANEALCGDPFEDPDWLPAAGECFVNCDPTVHMCLTNTESSVQKCRMFSQECQAGIRKYLGWSSTVVSVYRPETTPLPAFITAQPETIVDRTAVKAAEDIERDLMRSATESTVSFPDDGLSSKEASLSVEIITPAPNSNSAQWLEAAPVEENGFSYDMNIQGHTATEPQQDGYDTIPTVVADTQEYDAATQNNNNIEQEEVEAEDDDIEEESSSPSTLSSPKRLRMKLIPERRPVPSPPGFQPYYAKIPQMTPIPIVQSQVEHIVPKFINYLEPPFEYTDVTNPYIPAPVPQPPGFRPTAADSENDLESKETESPEENIYLQREATTKSPQSPPHSIGSFPTLKEISEDNRVDFTQRPPYSATKETSKNGARFEVLPPHQPLRHAMNVGSFDKSLMALPEQRRVHQYTDPNTHRKIIAEVQPAKARDLSRRCCEWSLNGLCDSHWQRVRRMCAKSCGTLVCEDIEGIKSCTRVVDVDVEDCFQSARLTRYFGLKNAETEEEKRSIIDGIIEQKLGGRRRKSRKRRHFLLRNLFY